MSTRLSSVTLVCGSLAFTAPMEIEVVLALISEDSDHGITACLGFNFSRKLVGIAKLTFCASFCVQAVMPTTSPRLFTTGPPLLPPEMGHET